MLKQPVSIVKPHNELKVWNREKEGSILCLWQPWREDSGEGNGSSVEQSVPGLCDTLFRYVIYLLFFPPLSSGIRKALDVSEAALVPHYRGVCGFSSPGIRGKDKTQQVGEGGRETLFRRKDGRRVLRQNPKTATMHCKTWSPSRKDSSKAGLLRLFHSEDENRCTALPGGARNSEATIV